MRGKLLLIVAVGAGVLVAAASAASLDLVRGTKGADDLNGTAGADLIYGYQGSDIIRAHGTALFKREGDKWVAVTSGGYRPAEAPDYATSTAPGAAAILDAMR